MMGEGDGRLEATVWVRRGGFPALPIAVQYWLGVVVRADELSHDVSDVIVAVRQAGTLLVSAREADPSDALRSACVAAVLGD